MLEIGGCDLRCVIGGGCGKVGKFPMFEREFFAESQGESLPVTVVSPCHHARPRAMTNKARRAAMERAEARCVAEGHRWTAPRRRVYELLLEAGGPVKAYDLMAAFAEGPAPKPMTIYRALEFLEAIGLAHRVASLNAFIACDHDARSHGAAFLICECCGRAEEFEPTIGEAAAAEVDAGFVIKSVTLEVLGRCGRCLADA